jgi:hypothetical protein
MQQSAAARDDFQDLIAQLIDLESELAAPPVPTSLIQVDLQFAPSRQGRFRTKKNPLTVYGEPLRNYLERQINNRFEVMRKRWRDRLDEIHIVEEPRFSLRLSNIAPATSDQSNEIAFTATAILQASIGRAMIHDQGQIQMSFKYVPRQNQIYSSPLQLFLEDNVVPMINELVNRARKNVAATAGGEDFNSVRLAACRALLAKIQKVSEAE